MSARVHGLNLYPGGQWFSEAGCVQRIDRKGRDPTRQLKVLTDNDRAKAAKPFKPSLGEGIAREMGRDRGKETLQVGDMFDLGGRRWIVVGITKSEGSTFGSEVWAKWSLVAHCSAKNDTRRWWCAPPTPTRPKRWPKI